MNDFTKDELKELYYALDEYYITIDSRTDLYFKVESMVDNYCEHKKPYTKWWELLFA